MSILSQRLVQRNRHLSVLQLPLLMTQTFVTAHARALSNYVHTERSDALKQRKVYVKYTKKYLSYILFLSQYTNIIY